MTWDGTVNENCVKIYIDDLIVPKYATKAKSQEESNVVRSSNFCIGTDPSTSTQNLCGDLKDIEIYSDVLNYNIKAEELTLNKYTDSLTVGQPDTLIATVIPDNATNKTVTWTSSDEGIVKVDQNGNITGLKAGTAIITATTVDGKTASCTVTVKDQELGKSKLTLYMNDKTIREFYLTQDEIDNFIDWYTSKIKGEVTMQPYYAFNVSVPGKSSTKKSYVWFMKIESFEVE